MSLLDPFEKSATNRDIERHKQEIIKAEERQTREIVAAEERMYKEIEYLRMDVQEVSTGIQELTSVVEWGLWEIAEKLNTQSKLLEEAVQYLKDLRQPRTLEANEARQIGIERFHNGWFEEAAESFQLCLEINKTDFLAHLFSAIIALKNDQRPIALEHAQMAAKYSEPYSKEWASFAWLFVARVRFLDGVYEQAQEAIKRALQFDKTSAPAHYELAQVMTKINTYQTALQSIETAIQLDPHNYDLVTNEIVFDPLRGEVTKLQKRLLDEVMAKARIFFDQGEQIQKIGQQVEQQIKTQYIQNNFITTLHNHRSELDKARQYTTDGSYVGIIIGRIIADKANQSTRKAISDEINNLINDVERKKGVSYRNWAQVGALILGFIGLVYTVIDAIFSIGHSSLNPVLDIIFSLIAILLMVVIFALIGAVIGFVAALIVNPFSAGKASAKVQTLQTLQTKLP